MDAQQLNSKQRYRTFCQTQQEIPFFLTDWWLDAVSGTDGWDVVLSEAKGEITGVWPFVRQKKGPFTLINMPKLTSYLGPWVIYPPGQKYVSRLGHEMEVLRELIAAMPKFDYYSQRFHHNLTNWLPFYWKGYEQTTRYTYVLELDNLDTVFSEFKSNIRGKIRKAEGLVTVTHDKSFDDFYRLLSLTYKRQGIPVPHSREVTERIEAALTARDCRKIFFAVDAEGRIHSALYLVWDKLGAYVHMVGEDPELRNSGAGILLIWKAIQFTRNELQLSHFDFLGSTIEPIEIVRRSFGAKQVPYFHLKKTPSRMIRAVQALQMVIRK